MKSYDKLYLRILELGQHNFKNGLSYNRLIHILKNEGYDVSNNCIQYPIKQWFYESYFHVTSDDSPQFKTIEDLDNHLNCNFMLRGEHCLKYMQNKTSRNSLKTSRIALFLSMCGIAFSGINTYINLKKTDELLSNHKEIMTNTQAKQTPLNTNQFPQKTPLPLTTNFSDTLTYIISIKEK